MYPALVLSAALLAPAAPIPRDTVPNAPGPAPRVLTLKADNSGAVRVIYTNLVKVTVTNTYFVMDGNNPNPVQKQVEQDVVTSNYFNKSLAEFNGKFSTADGRPLTLDEATARVKSGATVLASSDGKPIGKAWLQSVTPDTVVMVVDGLSHAQIQWGGPLRHNPRAELTLLATDDKGTLVAPTTSHPNNGNGAYYDDIAWEGRAIRGRAARFDGGGYYYGSQPADAKVVNKPLADVPFEAYNTSGKLVPRSEALKRLTAGGMVLVAGDNRMPDEAYLKGFHEDVLVLVSADLVLPAPYLDQTKKKLSEPNFVKRYILPITPAAETPQPIDRPGAQPLPGIGRIQK